MYTLDTNAIIYYLKDEKNTVLVLRDIFTENVPIYISAITEVELFGFPHLSEGEARAIDLLLQTLSIIPLDSRIARIAGAVRRKYHLKIPDSIIAATALFTGTALVTKNVSDFRSIPELSLKSL